MAIFVRADHPQAPPGLGKLIAVNGTQATVEYFNSPTDDPLILTFDTKLLSRHDVPTQTRAYWYDRSAFVWRVGRVIDGEGERLSIRFPNKDERHLPASELSIRWDRPIPDPTPYLANFVCETPLLADARSAFARAMTEQRAAFRAHPARLARLVPQKPVEKLSRRSRNSLLTEQGTNPRLHIP